MKVLVVDDDEHIIEMIKAALEVKGIEVISASTGLEGLAFILEDKLARRKKNK